jgi:hypothetical protein
MAGEALERPLERPWRPPGGAGTAMADGSTSASAQQDPVAPSSPGPALPAGEARSHGHGPWRPDPRPWPMAHGDRRIGGSSPWGKARLAGQGAVAAAYACLTRALAPTFSMKAWDARGGGLALPVAVAEAEAAAAAAAVAVAVAVALAVALALALAVAVAGPFRDTRMAVSVPRQMGLPGGSNGRGVKLPQYAEGTRPLKNYDREFSIWHGNSMKNLNPVVTPHPFPLRRVAQTRGQGGLTALRTVIEWHGSSTA